MRLLIPKALIVLFAAISSIAAQELPPKVRGYKVHNTRVSVGFSEGFDAIRRGSADVVISMAKPELAGMGLTGALFVVPAGITSFTHSGEVHFLMFRDFTVNGIPVEIDEYDRRIALRKGQTVRLDRPFRVFVRSTSLAAAAMNGSIAGAGVWKASGRVLVFGKFDRFGFGFKRVIPVRLEFEVADPLGRK